jgi:hypothetical protein
MNRVRAGRWLIAAGVAVWVVYGVVWLAGGEPHAGAYLPFHLAGVIPGFVLARWDWLRSRWSPAGNDQF